MSIDDKLDQLLADSAVTKTQVSQHTKELEDLKSKLEPIFDHVNGVKFVVKLGAGIVGIVSCLAGLLLLLK